jgi:hypothetical protein
VVHTDQLALRELRELETRQQGAQALAAAVVVLDQLLLETHSLLGLQRAIALVHLIKKGNYYANQ